MSTIKLTKTEQLKKLIPANSSIKFYPGVGRGWVLDGKIIGANFTEAKQYLLSIIDPNRNLETGLLQHPHIQMCFVKKQNTPPIVAMGYKNDPRIIGTDNPAIKLLSDPNGNIYDERLKYCNHLVHWQGNKPISLWSLSWHSGHHRHELVDWSSMGYMDDFKHYCRNESIGFDSYAIWRMPGIESQMAVCSENILKSALHSFRNEKKLQLDSQLIEAAFKSGNPHVKRSQTGKSFVIKIDGHWKLPDSKRPEVRKAELISAGVL